MRPTRDYASAPWQKPDDFIAASTHPDAVFQKIDVEFKDGMLLFKCPMMYLVGRHAGEIAKVRSAVATW
jgi:hypothetical protein